MHFFAFAQRVFLGKGFSFVTCQQCETRRGFPLPFWEGVGSVTRRTLENVVFAPPFSEHALRKVSSPPARGERNTRFGCAVNSARVVSMMRLQACQCHHHELPGSHWRVLAARPHCEVAVPRCHMSPQVPLFALFRPCYEGKEVVWPCQSHRF